MPTTAEFGRSPALAVIGGSGFYRLKGVDLAPTLIETPYSTQAIALQRASLEGAPLWFLSRHGKGHAVPAHLVNYRANIDALKRAGVRRIIAVNAVGGIDPTLEPGSLAIPDQLIDYTWGREHTFRDGLGGLHDHVDFTEPYCPRLRETLIAACRSLELPVSAMGVYGCTQGPRLETAAEIRRMRRDGCDLVGMTGMPEAALARELDMDYASLCLVVNRAAGVGDDAVISLEEIQRVLEEGMARVRSILSRAASMLESPEPSPREHDPAL